MTSRVDFTPSGKPVTHGGSGNAYSNYGCRCDECKKANRDRVNRRRAERDSNEALVHGKATTYSNWRCRCEPCSEAWNVNMRNQQQSRVERGLPEGDPRHGTTSAYTGWGCRCDKCREAASILGKKRYAAKKKEERDED